MEKNQHNNSTGKEDQHGGTPYEGRQPGQQLPANAEQTETGSQHEQPEKEQHSESSFPRKEGETLGTP